MYPGTLETPLDEGACVIPENWTVAESLDKVVNSFLSDLDANTEICNCQGQARVLSLEKIDA